MLFINCFIYKLWYVNYLLNNLEKRHSYFLKLNLPNKDSMNLNAMLVKEYH